MTGALIESLLVDPDLVDPIAGPALAFEPEPGAVGITLPVAEPAWTRPEILGGPDGLAKDDEAAYEASHALLGPPLTSATWSLALGVGCLVLVAVLNATRLGLGLPQAVGVSPAWSHLVLAVLAAALGVAAITDALTMRIPLALSAALGGFLATMTAGGLLTGDLTAQRVIQMGSTSGIFAICLAAVWLILPPGAIGRGDLKILPLAFYALTSWSGLGALVVLLGLAPALCLIPAALSPARRAPLAPAMAVAVIAVGLITPLSRLLAGLAP